MDTSGYKEARGGSQSRGEAADYHHHQHHHRHPSQELDHLETGRLQNRLSL